MRGGHFPVGHTRIPRRTWTTGTGWIGQGSARTVALTATTGLRVKRFDSRHRVTWVIAVVFAFVVGTIFGRRVVEGVGVAPPVERVCFRAAQQAVSRRDC